MTLNTRVSRLIEYLTICCNWKKTSDTASVFQSKNCSGQLRAALAPYIASDPHFVQQYCRERLVFLQMPEMDMFSTSLALKSALMSERSCASPYGGRSREVPDMS